MEDGYRSLNLARRQQCACLIQEIGSRIPTTQVVINAGLYYMHHIYEVFSPESVKTVTVALASLYIACKTEDFSRKLALLISVAYATFKKPMPPEDSTTYKRIVQNIHALEATILMSIGFNKLDVKQPHVILVTVLRENKFPKDVSHTSYYVCTNILHCTTLVLRHSMEAIAATSLYIAAKWNNFDIGCDGDWYKVFGSGLTIDEIRNMTEEFTQAFEACDAKLKEHMRFILKSRRLMQHDSLARRSNESHRVCGRGEKRPHDSQRGNTHEEPVEKKAMLPPTTYSGGGGVGVGVGAQHVMSQHSRAYGEVHADPKLWRNCPPQSRTCSQPPVSAVFSRDSALPYKCGDVQGKMQRDPGLNDPAHSKGSSSKRHLLSQNDLASIF